MAAAPRGRFYEVLGLSTSCPSADELKRAYKTAAKKHHPDRNRDNPAAADKFKEVAEALQVLSDPRKKQIYDQVGEAGLNNSAGPSRRTYSSGVGSSRGAANFADIDPFELFSKVSGMGRGDVRAAQREAGQSRKQGGFSERGAAPGPPIQPVVTKMLPCSLEQLYTGCTRKMKITRRAGGSASEKILEVTVQAGWKRGTKVTFAGAGDQLDSSGRCQDIVFVIQEKPHPRFTRDGNDLVIEAKVSAQEASKGLRFETLRLDGRTLSTVIAPGEARNAAAKVVPAEGMPIRKFPGTKGNLCIKFQVAPAAPVFR